MNTKKMMKVIFALVALVGLYIPATMFALECREIEPDLFGTNMEIRGDGCNTNPSGPGGGENDTPSTPNSTPEPEVLAADIQVSSASIALGNTVRVSWSSEHADKCVGTGFDTGNATLGYVDVSPTADTTFSVTCSRDIEVVNQCDPSVSCCSIRTTGRTHETRGTNNTCTLSCQAIGMVSIGIGVDTKEVSTKNGTVIEDVVRICESQETRYRGHEKKATNVYWDDNSARCYYTGQKHDDDRSDKVTTCYCGDSNLCEAEPYPYTPPTTTETETESETAEASVTVTEVVPEPTATLSSNPGAITEGESTTLTWSSANADTCTGIGFSTGDATSGSLSVSPTTDATYTVRCVGAGGVDESQAQVTVTEITDPQPPVAAPTVDLWTVPASIISGDTVRLKWSSTNADTCTGSGFITGGIVSNSVGVEITPLATTSYTITCRNAAGTATDTTSVQVSPKEQPPTATINVSPESITQGESVTITWSSTNATSCSGNGVDDFYTTATSGSVTKTPASNATYAVTCTGVAGSDTASDSVVVTGNPEPPVPPIPPIPPVPPTPGNVSADVSVIPTQIDAGETATLTWTSVNAVRCTGTGFNTNNAVSGSLLVSPSVTTQYTVECQSNSAADTDSETLIVVTTPIVPPTPQDCTFNGQPVLNGASVQAFQTQTVDYDTGACSSEQRTCSNGSLSGSYAFSSCIVENPVPADFTCSKTNSGFAACGGVYTLVQPRDPMYVLTSNIVERWYQCGTPQGVTAAFTDLAAPGNAQVSFTYDQSVQDQQFHNISLCLDSVNAEDVQKDFIIKLLNFTFEEE